MSETLKIGLIVSSTRQGRFADKVLAWFEPIAAAQPGWEIEVLDLREAALPFFDEPVPPAAKPVTAPAAQAWGDKLEAMDGFIVLTAEYNHSITAALKNAFDYAFEGWKRKPIGTVGYGGVGAARAVEHLRMIAINFGMVPVAGGVNIGGGDFGALMGGKSFADLGPHLEKSAEGLIADIDWWARAIKAAKAA